MCTLSDLNKELGKKKPGEGGGWRGRGKLQSLPGLFLLEREEGVERDGDGAQIETVGVGWDTQAEVRHYGGEMSPQRTQTKTETEQTPMISGPA